MTPDGLFVIACPVCRGHVAATGRLCGSDACCPLCASLFHVPTLTLTGQATPPSPPSPLPAEDWGNVIEKLAPPATKAVVPLETEQPSDFEIPPQPAPEPAGEQVLATSCEGSAPTMADASTAPVPPAEPMAHMASSSPLPPSDDWIDAVLAAPTPDELSEPPAPPEGVPYLGPTLVAPADQELEFREPVRTVRHGDTVVEIRRLTPEERQARRFRRNLMMIVIGVSILLAIVLIFGVPTKPR